MLSTIAAPGSATAQQSQQDERCKAPEQKSKTESDQAASSSAADSGKLADCAGVLQPPNMGDNGMVTPAPSVGNTPVIPPGHVPKGQSNGQPQSK
jgi:hypothetical protein